MKRTAEKVLAIISTVLTTLGIIMVVAFMAFFNFIKNDPVLKGEFEAELYATPDVTQADIDSVLAVFNLIGGFMWLGIILMAISLILTIVGLVNVWNDKNAKLAGILFIIAGLVGGIVSLPSIFLYIAGILCLTKKPTMIDDPVYVDDMHDGTMRPL